MLAHEVSAHVNRLVNHSQLEFSSFLWRIKNHSWTQAECDQSHSSDRIHTLLQKLQLLVFFISEKIMLSTYLAVCSVLNQLHSESKQDFTVTVSFSLYWSYHIYIFLFLSPTPSFGHADSDANAMCLFLSGAWKTSSDQERWHISAQTVDQWEEYFLIDVRVFTEYVWGFCFCR